jgi:hypothetical protein
MRVCVRDRERVGGYVSVDDRCMIDPLVHDQSTLIVVYATLRLD